MDKEKLIKEIKKLIIQIDEKWDRDNFCYFLRRYEYKEEELTDMRLGFDVIYNGLVETNKIIERYES